MANGYDAGGVNDPTLTDYSQLFTPLGITTEGSTGATGPVGPNYSQPDMNPVKVIQDAPGDIFNFVTNAIPGAKEITKLLGVVGAVVGELEKDLGKINGQHIADMVGGTIQHAKKAVTLMNPGEVHDLWQWINDHSFGGLFEAYLGGGLGLNVDEVKKDAGDAVKTIDTMLGFAFLTQFIAAGAEALFKLPLANRAPTAIKDTIAKLPEEMGLSWALGMTVDEAFKQALGVQLEEAINRQKSPNRIGWPQVRTMLKQHVIEPATYETLMENMGFPKEQRDWLSALQDAQIPIGDIAQLHYRGQITGDDAKARIKAQGFTDTDAQYLYDMYVDKAENEASVTYRSTGRRAFVDHLITADQYRTILTNANYPTKLIEDDVQAAQLAQTVGDTMLEVAGIKHQFTMGAIDDKQATNLLAQLGYHTDYIGSLLATWTRTTSRRVHSLSSAKVLSYLASGVLNETTVKPWLQSAGMSDEAINFLIAHPTAHAGVHVHDLTPGLVVQAYVDGVIDDKELPLKLKDAHTDGDVLSYYEQVAKYRKANVKHKKPGTLDLNVSEINAAVKYSLIDFNAAQERFKGLGYSDEAAMLLAEIANKGPNYPAQAPIFDTLGEAEGFLEGLGYVIHPPPDPRIAIAESMLESKGYSVTPPPLSPTGKPTLPPPVNPVNVPV